MEKVVLITGASSGFGKLTSELLASNGYKVYAGVRDVNGKNSKSAIALASQENIIVIELDVTKSQSVQDAVNRIKSETGRVDVLINSAGIAGIGLTEFFDTDKVSQLFHTNVIGVHNLTKEVLPIMRNQKCGLIISVSSLMGRMVLPTWGVYSATKFALEAMAESWRYELAHLGIDSIIIEPGAFPTTGIGEKMGTYSSFPTDGASLNEYGDLAMMNKKFELQMKELVDSGQSPDPMMVADAIKTSIETPFGQRKLRVTVDVLMGNIIDGLNEYTDKMQFQIFNPPAKESL